MCRDSHLSPPAGSKGTWCSLALPAVPVLSRACLAALLLCFGLEHLQPCSVSLKRLNEHNLPPLPGYQCLAVLEVGVSYSNREPFKTAYAQSYCKQWWKSAMKENLLHLGQLAFSAQEPFVFCFSHRIQSGLPEICQGQ